MKYFLTALFISLMPFVAYADSCEEGSMPFPEIIQEFTEKNPQAVLAYDSEKIPNSSSAVNALGNEYNSTPPETEGIYDRAVIFVQAGAHPSVNAYVMLFRDSCGEGSIIISVSRIEEILSSIPGRDA